MPILSVIVKLLLIEAYIQVKLRGKTSFYTVASLFVVKYTLLGSTEKAVVV